MTRCSGWAILFVLPSKKRYSLRVSAYMPGIISTLSKRMTDCFEPRHQEKKHKNGDKKADIVGTFGETRSVIGCTAFYYHSQYLAGFFGGRWEQRSATASHGETGGWVASLNLDSSNYYFSIHLLGSSQPFSLMKD
jgi:hypothetical protein